MRCSNSITCCITSVGLGRRRMRGRGGGEGLVNAPPGGDIQGAPGSSLLMCIFINFCIFRSTSSSPFCQFVCLSVVVFQTRRDCHLWLGFEDWTLVSTLSPPPQHPPPPATTPTRIACNFSVGHADVKQRALQSSMRWMTGLDCCFSM